MKRKRSELQRLRDRVTTLNGDLNLSKQRVRNLIDDREKFREFFLLEFRKHIETNGKNQYTPAAVLIERFAKFLGKVESWYWS